MGEVVLVHGDVNAPSLYAPDLGPERNFIPLAANLRIMYDGEQVGEVVIYHADLSNGTAWLALGFDTAHRRMAVPWMGVVQALDYVFTGFEFRQLYIEALEHLAYQFRRAVRDGYMVEVGRLPQAWWWEDHYEDLVNYVITREAWEAQSDHYQKWLAR